MITELTNYEIFPKILPADQETEIVIRPLGAHAAFDDGALYSVQVLPMTVGEPQSHRMLAAGGLLRFRHFFDGEREHVVRVFADLDETERVVSLAVYSLLPDLFERRPYKGDFHAHSCRSDGKEAPAVMVANYRKAGFDFMAVTDHGQWDPSDEAVQAWAGRPVDIRVFHGEEVHSPGNHIHIVNFGGSFSVNDLAFNDQTRYEAEVETLRADIGVLPAGVDGFEYAACIWSSQKIRGCGGMGIFCHPHWIANAYHVPDAMTWYILKTMPLDAFELFGGQTVPENNMQLAMYNDARAQGCVIPIVASSDSHGTVNANWFNWVSTVVFSKSLELAELIEAVKSGYSAAQEHYPGEHPRIHGSYRMASYAMFLLREYWPLHDELCYEEGRAMKAFLCGDTDERKILELTQGRTARLLERCFGDQGNRG